MTNKYRIISRYKNQNTGSIVTISSPIFDQGDVEQQHYAQQFIMREAASRNLSAVNLIRRDVHEALVYEP